MRLLLDENLSPMLVGRLGDLFPGSVHVHGVGLGGGDDGSVWSYAKAHGFAIMSKDSDFMERRDLGHPLLYRIKMWATAYVSGQLPTL